MNENIFNESMQTNKRKDEHALKRKKEHLRPSCTLAVRRLTACLPHDNVQSELQVTQLSGTIMARKCTLASKSDTNAIENTGKPVKWAERASASFNLLEKG